MTLPIVKGVTPTHNPRQKAAEKKVGPKIRRMLTQVITRMKSLAMMMTKIAAQAAALVERMAVAMKIRVVKMAKKNPIGESYPYQCHPPMTILRFKTSHSSRILALKNRQSPKRIKTTRSYSSSTKCIRLIPRASTRWLAGARKVTRQSRTTENCARSTWTARKITKSMDLPS